MCACVLTTNYRSWLCARVCVCVLFRGVCVSFIVLHGSFFVVLGWRCTTSSAHECEKALPLTSWIYHRRQRTVGAPAADQRATDVCVCVQWEREQQRRVCRICDVCGLMICFHICSAVLSGIYVVNKNFAATLYLLRTHSLYAAH